MASKGLSTINTVLKIGTNGSLSKVTPIKSYPDLFGSPDTLEVTDLDDEQQMFVGGVKSTDGMEFTANFLHSTFDALKDLENQDLEFELDFGDSGIDGKFTWTGQLSVRVSGGDVNAAREMVITVFPDSDIEDAANSRIDIIPSAKTITVGDTFTIQAYPAPSSASVTYTSSASGVASVTSGGLVEGEATGTATITASITVDETSYTDTCVVTVEAGE